MKVAIVIDGLGTGGAERSLAELLPHLPPAGIQPVVVCLHRRSEGVERAVLAGGADVRFLGGRRLPSRVRALRRILAAERPDLVHTTLFSSHLVGRLAAAGTGVPVASSLVNTPYDEVRFADPGINPLALRAVRIVDGWTARHLTAHFHAITAAVGAAAVESLRIAPDRITVIQRGRQPSRLGVPSPERRARVRAALGLSPDVRVVLNVGRQEYQKGQRHLLEALRRLAKTHPHLHLLIAGREGSATPDLRARAEVPELQGRVRWLGHRDDVPDLMAAADVFAFPSLFEGLGGSVVEAMALEVPIVASDVPALAEVLALGACGELVPSGDDEALANAIARLLDDPARAAALAARARAEFLQRFTFTASLEATLAWYRRIAAGPSPTAGPRTPALLSSAQSDPSDAVGEQGAP